MQYIWLAVLIAAVLLEAATAGLVSIWFVPAALVSMILAFFGVEVYLQWVVFLGLSLIFLILSRTVWKKYISAKPPVPTNSDALIGKEGVVSECIDNLRAGGEVKVQGQRWSARSADGTVIEVGEVVTVTAIEGVKLICKKQ